MHTRTKFAVGLLSFSMIAAAQARLVPCSTRITAIVVAHQHKWEYFPDPLPCCPMVAVLNVNTNVVCFNALYVTEPGICAGYDSFFYPGQDPDSGNATADLCPIAPDPLVLTASSGCTAQGGDCVVTGPDNVAYGNAAVVEYAVARQQGQKITATSRVVYAEERGTSSESGRSRFLCEGYPYAVGNGVIPFDFSCY